MDTADSKMGLVVHGRKGGMELTSYKGGEEEGRLDSLGAVSTRFSTASSYFLLAARRAS